jgi:HPt (histidine-containing phosphotransfer) domain-containing protein
MIKLFCIEIPEALISIEDGLITDDVDKIKRTAHKIKPALETMGISTLHGPISALEKMSMIDKDTNELVKKVKRVCDTVIEDFEKSI